MVVITTLPTIVGKVVITYYNSKLVYNGIIVSA